MAVSGQIKLSIDSRREHVSLVGAALRSICAQIHLPDVETDQLELCVCEAVNNTIEHAYDMQSGHTIDVSVNIENELIQLTIEDTGRKMTMSDSPPLLDFDPDNLEELPEGGMGLFIIHSLMDEINYLHSAGKNRLSLIKRLPPLAAPCRG